MTTPTQNKKVASEASTAETPSTSSRLVIADLGKRSRKQVKRLKKGRGRLSNKVSQLVEELKTDGIISEHSDTVVVLVEKKARGKRRWGTRW